MSQHPSLREDSVGAKHRNVLKRFERIKKLQEINKWPDQTSVFGLPKVKSLKIKVKKVKEPKAEDAAAGAAPATPGAPAAKTGAAAPAAKPGTAAPAGKTAAPAAAKADKGKK